MAHTPQQRGASLPASTSRSRKPDTHLPSPIEGQVLGNQGLLGFWEVSRHFSPAEEKSVLSSALRANWSLYLSVLSINNYFTMLSQCKTQSRTILLCDFEPRSSTRTRVSLLHSLSSSFPFPIHFGLYLSPTLLQRWPVATGLGS